MGLPRHDRIRLVAAGIVAVTAILFIAEPRALTPGSSGGTAVGLGAAALLALAGTVALGGALRGVADPALPAAARAGALPWIAFYGVIVICGLGGVLGALATGAWALWPAGAVAGTFLATVVGERVGLRQGLLCLPLLASFGLLAAAAADLDPRYLQALLLIDVLVVPLLVTLLPAPGRHDRGWYLAAGGWALTAIGLLLWGPALGHAVAAATTLALWRLHPPVVAAP